MPAQYKKNLVPAHADTRFFIHQDFEKFDSSRSEVQDIDELNHFDLYLVHWKSLMGFLQNPHTNVHFQRHTHQLSISFNACLDHKVDPKRPERVNVRQPLPVQ